MSSDTVQCPHCDTRFRTNSEQLRLADGLVRCGRCMQIFNAIDGSAIPTLEETKQESAATTTTGQTTRDVASETDKHASPQTEQDSNEGEEGGNEAARDPLQLLNSLSTVNHDFEHHMPPPQPRRWPWILASLVALLTLAAQLAQWQMPQLLASPYGDEIESYCNRYQLPCEPETEAKPGNIDHISSSNLIVRKHPEHKDALIVDTLLTNKSDQASPFPALHLRFSDINDHTIASRVFQPREYLSGELNALSDLASQQPIHVVLEIRDPGSNAVNYQLKLQPAYPGFNRR